MRVRVGCELIYDSLYPTPMIIMVRPRDWHGHRMIDERRTITPETVPVHEFVDNFGNYVWRMVTPVGRFEVRYDAVAEVPPTPDPVFAGLPKTPVEHLPDEVLMYTLPSRHCQADLFIDDAWKMFGGIPTGWEQVQAVCDWLHTNIIYGKGSTSNTSGFEAYNQRRGVCRDFAHLGVSFCRALNIPARYVCSYLPDINVEPDPTPMDFHAWFEAYLDGAWRTFDARHNRQRTGRVMIAYGRDAVDVSLSTSYGSAQLTGMKVWADEVDESFMLAHGLIAA